MGKQADRGLSISLPPGFVFGAVPSGGRRPAVTASPPPGLGALAAFVGSWRGVGFNTIFRPNGAQTPTPLPIPVAGSDNVLELNLTSESLTFSPSLGSVPNRGMVQGDIFLNGVPYLQVVDDVTTPGQVVGIHVEPGIWMCVPPTTAPALGQTLARMASIPHGTTIEAQGTSAEIDGPPTIPAVDITPFLAGSNPPSRVPFPSQVAAAQGTARIPQDLTPFINAGTITQGLLTDPNTILRDRIAHQKITRTTIITIATNPAPPLFGGGTANIAFLQGDPAAARPNAQAIAMSATFWIETVEHVVEIPTLAPGRPATTILGGSGHDPEPLRPVFVLDPTTQVGPGRHFTIHTTQIQYSQQVMLNFNGLTWPHVSVATLVPAGHTLLPPDLAG